jgi:hypothetical protein
MNFIKLGKRYINLDAIAAVIPRKKGFGYTVNFIGGTKMDICEMDMADIRRALQIAQTESVAIKEINSMIGIGFTPKEFSDWMKKGQHHERSK